MAEAAFAAGEACAGAQGELVGSDFELGDGGNFGGWLARVSRGEKCASRGVTCFMEIVGRSFGGACYGGWREFGGRVFWGRGKCW